MRLNQYIAHHSKFSRREADALIESGRVKLNHTKATLQSVLGAKDKVFVDGKLLRPVQKYTAIIYHKPKGELVSKRDDRGRRTIYDSLDSKFRGFSYVGRLDYASEGLLILSDSKQVVHSLSTAALPRTYNLKLSHALSPKLLDSVRLMLEEGRGFEIDNPKGAHTLSKIHSLTLAPFLGFEILRDSALPRVRVVLEEGKNRELRRFFAQFGYEILDLKRVGYGFCSLNNLPCGKWRYFTKEEYKKLRAFLGECGAE
ncbi:pseudouridine synthase [uncultured Helicobacter sp.]|uniref:pseudouridine synthase n=1 Tax=uncultured Helicobacter sp. TaxID=175537 RepID=UPI0037500586